MIKPEHLKKGDKVAFVSTSAGTMGEPWAIHKYYLAKERLEKDFGLEVVTMEHTLAGSDFIEAHPEARAQDLMDAFKDPSIKGIINAIGGCDAIRMLPYIDFDVIKNNPKVFTGFSDTTAVHMMMYKAGLCSYYGANILNNFSEYVKINDYTDKMIRSTIFEPVPELDIPSSDYFYDDEFEKIWWGEDKMDVYKPYQPEEIGYEVVQGEGQVVEGELLGGCIDVFIQLFGTPIWPTLDQWEGKIAFLETSDEDMSYGMLTRLLQNMAAQGIFSVLKGIIVGKPTKRSKYEGYKDVFKKVVGEQAKCPDLPILSNVNFGHAEPIGVIPYGVKARLDTENKKITLLESATK